MSHRLYLLTGSDHPLRAEILTHARELIAERIGSVESASQLLKSRAWGFNSQSEFLNQALEVATSLSPMEALEEALHIEQLLGRDREAELHQKSLTGEPYASRVVDIDLLFYDDYIIESERLTLPHPLLHEREFVLRPLAQIAPTLRHPILGESIEHLANQFPQGQ